jgi:hypothetical protein
MRAFADPIVGDLAFAGVYAVYPWCGHQFARPDVGPPGFGRSSETATTGCRCNRSRPRCRPSVSSAATPRFGSLAAHGHSFDREEEVYEIPEASVAPAAPTTYLTDDGAMVDHRTGQANPTLTDHDMFMAAIDSDLGRWGAT